MSNQQSHNTNSNIAVQLPSASEPVPLLATPEKSIISRSTSTLQVVLPKYPISSQQQSTPSRVSKEDLTQDFQATDNINTPSRNAPPTPSNPSLAVVIPGPRPDFRPQDYEVLPDSPGTPQDFFRKRDTSELDRDDMARAVDQREKADTAYKQFRSFLGEVFEAEDQMQPDANPTSAHLTISGDGVTMSTAAQVRVDSLLQKVISMGRFAALPIEDLSRLQKLCEPAAREAENVDVKIDIDMGSADVESLMSQLTIAELGLRAVRISLRLMLGGREEKQLYSEEIIQTALSAFKNLIERCVIPIVEMRSSGSTTALFKLLAADKKSIINSLQQSRKLLSTLATLVGTIQLSDMFINTLEATASQLIFVDNAASEKDSILGTQKFDALRIVAMDVLARIFQTRPELRRGIFDEILTSLERLPLAKQNARQYKLPEGGSIQLVSALIMRLVQTSGCKVDVSKHNRRAQALQLLVDEDTPAEAAPFQDIPAFTVKTESRAEQQAVTAIAEMKTVAIPLQESAVSNATYVVNFIVSRASTSSKSGDSPFRNLLDLFIEDFISCLNATEWPAAETMLRYFLYKAVALAEGERIPAPAKNMALDILGTMGAAISDLNSYIRKSAGSSDTEDGGFDNHLARISEAALEKRLSGPSLVSWTNGPFRIVQEYLEQRSKSDAQFLSAAGFYKLEWTSKISSTYDQLSDDDSVETEQEYGRLAYRLRSMIIDSKWLTTEYDFDTVNPSTARLAHSLTLLNSPFCQSFGRILTILLGSMTSEQATVRSKSIKSINQLLDTDPSILDRESAVMPLIVGCSNDSSISVRDSALGLIAKCITLRPTLEAELLDQYILPRINDSGVGVRKRAMRMSKDIYLKNKDANVRSRIAGNLLHRVTDLDETVQELARQTIEEVWMSPFYQPTTSEDTSVQFRIAMADHVALMIKTIQHSGVATVLDKVLQSMLAPTSKTRAANLRVCKALVATMFETIIDNSSGSTKETTSARDALRILEIFAKSNKDLFTPEQVHLLQPYTANVNTADDLAIFRSVVIIFKHVLPNLSKAHTSFLAAIKKALLVTLTKFPPRVVEDVVACLWIISEVLDDLTNLTAVVKSSLSGIRQCSNLSLKDPAFGAAVKKVCKLLTITGIIGKYCDLDSQADYMRSQFPMFKSGESVSKLMTDTFAPFAHPNQPLEVRKAALEAIGMVCQSWPKNFRNVNISTAIKEVFQSETSALEVLILGAFKDFLLREEKRSESGSDSMPGSANDPSAKLGVMGGGHGDGIALGLAQEFLVYIKDISTRTMDEEALLAVEVIASITRQGLVHPKECGPTLIALETSPNPKIAEVAFNEHRSSHEKHETILEKEYMTAVMLAYEYQRDIVQDTHGATLNPFASKLHHLIDVLKISKVKNRKRLFDHLCARLEFPAKMDLDNELGQHLDFSEFIIENLAFFEYATVDELMSTVSAMDRVVNTSGTSVQLSIETEIFHVTLEQTSQVDVNGQVTEVKPPTSPVRLRQLTAMSMMLSNLWATRTYLRRQYGLVSNHGKAKGVAKDLNRAPLKVQGVTADKYWDEIRKTMSALESEEKMREQCKAFIDVLSLDPDFKLAAEADEDTAANGARFSTPSDNEDGELAAVGSGRGRKRKGTNTPGGRKKRARSSSVGPRSRG